MQAPLHLPALSPSSAAIESSFLPSSLASPTTFIYASQTQTQAAQLISEVLVAETTDGAEFHPHRQQNPTAGGREFSDVVAIKPEVILDVEETVDSWSPEELSLPARIKTKAKDAITSLSLGITQLSASKLLHAFNPSTYIWPDQTPSNDEKEHTGGGNPREIPDYVLEYAPYVHLYSEERFWPCDIADHLQHTTPYLKYIPLRSKTQHSSLCDLDDLNFWDGGYPVYLTSDDDVEDLPTWLTGEKNIPVADSSSSESDSDYKWRQHLYDRISTVPRDGESDPQKYRNKPLLNRKDQTSGESNAPAVLIVIDKGDGVVDAFWFYFYSFNLGNVVLNVRFGNHIGDWEHSLVRFRHGKPETVFMSEHSTGEAYSYDAVEKIGKRPVIYSATGTHAMYATPGSHPYVLPWGLLHDQTDRGPLWDPALNLHAYTYNVPTDTLLASNITPTSPTQWFYYNGHWGDKGYPMSDERQYKFAGQYHYVGGPLGPRYKNLGRKHVCQGPEKERCVVHNWLRGEAEEWERVREYPGVWEKEGEEIGEEDIERLFG